MKSTDVLRARQADIREVFDEMCKADDLESKSALFWQVASLLTSLDIVERELFYPAYEDAVGLSDHLGAALVEHGLLEFALFQAMQALPRDHFGYRCAVLRDVVERHFVNEEAAIFVDADQVFVDAMSEELGMVMNARFEQVVSSDFRRPLQLNLAEVLKGELKTAVRSGGRPYSVVRRRFKKIPPSRAA